MLTDEEVHKLWHSPDFEGSYRGLRTFQVILKTNLNEDISLKRLHDILSQDSLYLIHQRTVRNFPRRKYYVHSYGELCQMDIAVMFPDKESGYRYFLLLVDIFSTKVFTVPLKSREVNDIIAGLRKIIVDFKSQIFEIQADREASFLALAFKKFLKEQNIIFRDNTIKLYTFKPYILNESLY